MQGLFVSFGRATFSIAFGFAPPLLSGWLFFRYNALSMRGLSCPLYSLVHRWGTIMAFTTLEGRTLVPYTYQRQCYSGAALHHQVVHYLHSEYVMLAPVRHVLSIHCHCVILLRLRAASSSNTFLLSFVLIEILF